MNPRTIPEKKSWNPERIQQESRWKSQGESLNAKEIPEKSSERNPLKNLGNLERTDEGIV